MTILLTCVEKNVFPWQFRWFVLKTMYKRICIVPNGGLTKYCRSSPKISSRRPSWMLLADPCTRTPSSVHAHKWRCWLFLMYSCLCVCLCVYVCVNDDVASFLCIHVSSLYLCVSVCVSVCKYIDVCIMYLDPCASILLSVYTHVSDGAGSSLY